MGIESIATGAPATKELSLTIKVRNNLLKSRREKLGLSGPDFADRAGVSYPQYIALEALRSPPRLFQYLCRIPACGGRATGVTAFLCKEHQQDGAALLFPVKSRWKPLALSLARFYGVEPEALFPESVQRVTNPLIEREVDVSDLEAVASLTGSTLRPEIAELAAMGPGVHMDREDVRRAIHRCLGTLSPREESVVRRRFGLYDGNEQTLNEIAEQDGVSPKCIGDVEQRALRKIRHVSSRAKSLKEVMPDDIDAREAPICRNCAAEPPFKSGRRWLPIHAARLESLGWAARPHTMCPDCQTKAQEVKRNAEFKDQEDREIRAAFEAGPNLHRRCGGLVVVYHRYASGWPVVRCLKCLAVWDATSDAWKGETAAAALRRADGGR